MGIGIKARYYCVNVTACELARKDHVFSEQDHRENKGRCSECNAELRLGDPLDRRGRWLAYAALGMVCTVGIGWAVKTTFFPAPLEAITFTQHEIHIEDRGGALPIVVSRSGDASARAVLRFKSSDGTAKAGQHYEPIDDKVVFEPGQTRQTINVVIVPARGYLETDVYFSLVLLNVVGQPRETIFLEEPKVDEGQKKQVERTVRNASVLATDVADNVVRERVANTLLGENRADPVMFGKYQQKLEAIQGDLRRSRESYAQAFADMAGLQPRAVLDAMDSVSQQLRQTGFDQQAGATMIMKRQFERYLQDKAVDMDRWADELSTIVPRPSSASPGRSAT